MVDAESDPARILNVMGEVVPDSIKNSKSSAIVVLTPLDKSLDTAKAFATEFWNKAMVIDDDAASTATNMRARIQRIVAVPMGVMVAVINSLPSVF